MTVDIIEKVTRPPRLPQATVRRRSIGRDTSGAARARLDQDEGGEQRQAGEQGRDDVRAAEAVVGGRRQGVDQGRAGRR